MQLVFWLKMLGALASALVLLALLHQMSSAAKRSLIVAFTFLGGLFYALEFFLPPHPTTEEARIGAFSLTATATTVGNATAVISGFTFLLGVYNLVAIHGRTLTRRRSGWPYSLAFFVSFAVMAVAGYWKDWQEWFGGAAPPSWIKDTNAANAAQPHDLYTFLFEGFYRNLDATMFSILAFYIVSAAYRAFRIRTAEAAVLMVVALILMLGQVPVGMALTNWIPQSGVISTLRIEKLSQWVLTAINSPVQRAIGFGLGLGALAMSLRIWLSLERGTYFGQEE